MKNLPNQIFDQVEEQDFEEDDSIDESGTEDTGLLQNDETTKISHFLRLQIRLSKFYQIILYQQLAKSFDIFAYQ